MRGWRRREGGRRRRRRFSLPPPTFSESLGTRLVYSIHVQNGIEATYCCTLTGAHLNPVESTVAIPVFDV